MTANGWFQIAIFSVAVFLIAKPLGLYLVRVYDGSIRWMRPIERGLYRLAGIDPMTRGSLTTFSIANDVAKYFAIIPAMFLAFYPQLEVLNIMHLASPQSAILSAIIFNALIIIALIPLALKGVAYRAIGTGALLRRNLMIYGVGGIIIPFIGIKAIDLAVAALGLA